MSQDNCSLTDSPHSVWVDDSSHHHRQLHRPGFRTTFAWRGQDTAVWTPGKLNRRMKYSNDADVLCIMTHTDDVGIHVVIFKCKPICPDTWEVRSVNISKSASSHSFSFSPLSPTPSVTCSLFVSFICSGWYGAVLYRDLLFWVWDKDSRPRFRLS